MIKTIEIPDIGDFDDIPVIEITVAVGDIIEIDAPVLMLESDKATMDIPSPVAGKVTEILVQVGENVSQGTAVLKVEVEAAETAAEPQTAPAAAAEAVQKSDDHASLIVIGGGPGGYTAAFRAADLGRSVVLIDAGDTLGGVCLNVGCIPSKALLHIAKLRDEASEAANHGLKFAEPEIDIDAIRGFKDGVVKKLTSGLTGLAKRRKVKVIKGRASFTGANSVAIDTGGSTLNMGFDQAIIAVGSEPVKLPFLPEDPRIIDSTGALDLQDIPERLLIVGGGIIGLELAQVYRALGSKIHIVELADQIIPGADADLIRPLANRLKKKGVKVSTATRVSGIEAGKDLVATLVGPKEETTEKFDRALIAVGRRPNGKTVDAENAGVAVSENGYIAVDSQMRTNQPHIFAIGDVVGQPMLAHKATNEAKVAAEVACGEKVAFDPACIPSVAYTEPEVAWVGLTETEAKADGRKIAKGSFPWAASGRALSIGGGDGFTKLILDPETGKVLGGGIVGTGAGELIAEIALAVEMGADAHDVGLTIHPHPTLSETVAFAAEAFNGTLTDL